MSKKKKIIKNRVSKGHPNLPSDFHIDVHICVSIYTLHTGMHTYTPTHAHMQIYMNTHTQKNRVI